MIFSWLQVVSCFLAFVVVFPATGFAQDISQAEAVRRAERFVLENGYTSATADQVRAELDPESIERSSNREKVLAGRFNTLKPKAIGAKIGARGRDDGWSIAFDFTSAESSEGRPLCRVLTMSKGGVDLRMEHVDGFRESFAGFDH